MPLQTTYPVDQATLESTIAPAWNPACHITYNRDGWVKLMQPPSEYAADEAKLLCQDTSDTWVAWVPNHGEVVLDRSQFYC